MEQGVDIFAYSNFRLYIRDSYEYRHKLNRNFSHRFVSRILGEKSPSFLQKLIDNERRLNPHQVEALIRTFGLADHEAKYFRVLYLYSTASTRTEQELYLDQLVSLNHTPRRELSEDLCEYYKSWYNPVVRSLLSITRIGNDYKRIANAIKPKITPSQAMQAVKLLAKLKLISMDADGYWIPTDEGLFTKDAFHDAFIQGYRQQCLDLASSIIASGPDKETSHFSTAVMSVSDEARDRIQRKLDKFRSDVRSIVRKDAKVPVQVIQLQIQAFPLTEKTP